MTLTLYDYFRSSAAYRVRIALHLKKIAYKSVPVHLVRDGGEHRKDWYRAINPQGRVPALAVEENGETTVLTQSLAILDWLEARFPAPSIFPADALVRAKALSVAEIVACDIHPLNNLSTMAYLKGPLGQDQDAVNAWYAHWIREGFAAIEALIGPGPFCFGDDPSIADICLVPQLFNARRFKVPLNEFPKILAVEAACGGLDAFVAARPENQPNAE